MSLHTIVGEALAGRLGHHPRRARAAVAHVRTTDLAVRLNGASMRVLETGLAVTAVATALLIGLGR